MNSRYVAPAFSSECLIRLPSTMFGQCGPAVFPGVNRPSVFLRTASADPAAGSSNSVGRPPEMVRCLPS